MKLDENGNMVDEAPVVTPEDLQDFISDNPVDVVEDGSPSEGVTNTPITSTPDTIKVEGSPEGVAPTESPIKEDVVVSQDLPVSAEPVTAQESVDTVDPKDAQIAALTELVNKLSGGDAAAVTTKDDVKPTAHMTPIESLDALLESVDFDEIMESKQKFVEFFKTAMNVVREDTVQRTLTNIPQVVGTFVQRQATLRDVATEFYSTYPELKRVKPFVTHTANAVSAEHADWSLQQVLAETAVRVKEALQLKNDVVEGTRADVTKHKPKPSLPGGSQGTKSPMKPSNELQAEIDDLIND